MDGLDDVLFEVELVVAHQARVDCHGCVFVGVASLVSLNQVFSSANWNHFICLSMNNQKIASKLNQLLFIIEVLLDKPTYTAH